MSVVQPENTRRLKLILHGLFLISGTVTVLIGQLLPLLARHYALNDLQLSLYFPSQFSGSIVGTFLTSRFASKNQFLAASMIGAGLMGFGVLMMNVDSFAVSLAAFFINGVGIGLTLPAINMTILELSPTNTASSLSLLNFFWGVGAILCKPFVDISSRGTDILITTVVLSAPLLISAALLYSQPTPLIAHSKPDANATEDVPLQIWRQPIAWAIALFNFIHVGFESGMGGWLTTYAERLDEPGIVRLLSPTFLYFLFFVAGRGVAPVLFRFLNENKMLFLGLAIMLGGMAVVLSADGIFALSIGSCVAGFGTSWIFPANVSRFSKTFGPAATRRATPLFIAGTLGAAAVTWLIGFISNQTGSLHSGMYILIICVLLLIALQIGLSLGRRATA